MNSVIPNGLTSRVEGNGWSCKYARRQWDLVDNKNLTYHYMGDFDKNMLKVLKSVKNFQTTPVQEIWHNDGDQVLAYGRKDLIFVFNFNPKQSFTDYGFLVTPGAYEVILNTDDVAFGGNGLADDSVVHFTIADPLYSKEKKEWLKLYIPARTAVVLEKEEIILSLNKKPLQLSLYICRGFLVYCVIE